jgi:hypothetical protein
VCRITDISISEKVEANLISFLDWGFIDKGGYINININQSGAYVDNRSILLKQTDPRDPSLKLFKGPENWVYQTEVSATPSPNIIPLVYVNNTLDLSPTINYRDGIVSPSINVPVNAVVKASYSYKWVTFLSSRKSYNTKRVDYRQNRTDLNDPNNEVLSEIRVPLPCVSVDVPSVSKSRPYGLDRLGPRIYTFFVNLSIIGESASETSRISDYICVQQGTNFSTFDPKLVVAADDFPLNFDVTLNSAKNHQQLSEDYPWSTIYIEEAQAYSGSYIHQNIYESFVRLKLELVACFGC